MTLPERARALRDKLDHTAFADDAEAEILAALAETRREAFQEAYAMVLAASKEKVDG